ncbi:MAG TPA: hypothetical protein VK457_24370 [Chloroflexota bacterium]|nr:hypothetical protein [Chloroflexota bacterium]
MTIQIWSMSTRNLIGEYRTEDQALRAIRRDIERLGKGCTRDLAMGDPDGRGPVIRGAELATRALRRFPEKRSA